MTEKISGTAENWESGALGMSEAHAVRASDDLNKKIDDALGLKLTSIRLPKKVVDGFEIMAKRHSVCAPSLMSYALSQFLNANKQIDD